MCPANTNLNTISTAPASGCAVLMKFVYDVIRLGGSKRVLLQLQKCFRLNVVNSK